MGEGFQGKFPDLFYLSDRQGRKIIEMGSWIDGRWNWEMKWNIGLLEKKESNWVFDEFHK